jgi:hypothetical protein
MLMILSHVHNLVANNLQLHGSVQSELAKFHAVAVSAEGTIASRPD